MGLRLRFIFSLSFNIFKSVQANVRHSGSISRHSDVKQRISSLYSVHLCTRLEVSIPQLVEPTRGEPVIPTNVDVDSSPTIPNPVAVMTSSFLRALVDHFPVIGP